MISVFEDKAMEKSGFRGFADLNELCGFGEKWAKAQEPSLRLKDLGMSLSIEAYGDRVGSWTSRVEKQVAELQAVRAESRLLPAKAGRLAGKGGFLDLGFHGRVGRAARKQFFRRQYALSNNPKLTTPLRAACCAMEMLYTWAPARFCPYEL